MSKWVIFLIVTGTMVGGGRRSDGAINCANTPNVVTVSGPQYVGVNKSATYTCSVGTLGGTYVWTYPGFTFPAGQGTSTLVIKAKGTPSASKGDKKVKCVYTRPEGACDGSVDVTIVEANVTPNSMDVIESLDSETFTCTVLPAGLSLTYKWLEGSDENAWPASAGNTPALNYDTSTLQTTKVQGSQWFAPTPSRLLSNDGCISTYEINCEVTVGGKNIRDVTPGSLKVEVDPVGETVGPFFENESTIQLQETGVAIKTWSVVGIGSFQRATVTSGVEPPSSSDFYLKCMAHEDEHVDQWANQSPWKDLWNAATLYNNTLQHLTSNSESGLRLQINNAINNQHNIDQATHMDPSIVYAREKPAYDAGYAEDPDFLEMTEDEWKSLYNTFP